MHWTPDRTGRFPERPYYSTGELDHLCEQLITTFLTSRHHHVVFPVATDDLTVLIEYLGATLDSSADLSAEETGTHGYTDFIPGSRPLVRIARQLSAHPRYENRLRTTLTHEGCHVWLHRPLYEARRRLGHLFGGDSRVTYRCEPTTMLRAPAADWAEWQAGYVSGALLMPVAAICATSSGGSSSGSRCSGGRFPSLPIRPAPRAGGRGGLRRVRGGRPGAAPAARRVDGGERRAGAVVRVIFFGRVILESADSCIESRERAGKRDERGERCRHTWPRPPFRWWGIPPTHLNPCLVRGGERNVSEGAL